MSLSNECLMWAVHVPAHGECRNVQHARVAAGRLCCRLRSPGSSAFMPLRGWPAGASRADRADMHVCLRMAEQTPHLSKYHHMPRQAHRGGRVFDPAGPKYARYPASKPKYHSQIRNLHRLRARSSRPQGLHVIKTSELSL